VKNPLFHNEWDIFYHRKEGFKFIAWSDKSMKSITADSSGALVYHQKFKEEMHTVFQNNRRAVFKENLAIKTLQDMSPMRHNCIILMYMMYCTACSDAEAGFHRREKCSPNYPWWWDNTPRPHELCWCSSKRSL
jgi:hypothetical protein